LKEHPKRVRITVAVNRLHGVPIALIRNRIMVPQLAMVRYILRNFLEVVLQFQSRTTNKTRRNQSKNLMSRFLKMVTSQNIQKKIMLNYSTSLIKVAANPRATKVWRMQPCTMKPKSAKDTKIGIRNKM
jgi:hypothetical protein